METALFIIQIGVVVAALWYTLETRRMRLQNTEEIRLLAKQGRLSLAPFLVPGTMKLTTEQLIKSIEDNEELTDEEKKAQTTAAAKEDVFFVVQIDNPTADKVGSHIEPYIYDPATKSFLIPHHGKEWISPGESEIVQVTGPYVTRKKIEEELEDSYGNVVRTLYKHLDTPDDSGYIALFFQDVEGSLYLSKRSFTHENGKTSHRPTKLFTTIIS